MILKMPISSKMDRYVKVLRLGVEVGSPSISAEAPKCVGELFENQQQILIILAKNP